MAGCGTAGKTQCENRGRIIMTALFWEHLQDFYREVDIETAKLAEIYKDRLQCKKGCADCCIDDLTIFRIEAENIRHSFPELLENETAASPGQCAFLNETGACRIYDQRPYVCRTQGLPLRWFSTEDFPPLEFRDICPLNESGQEITDISDDKCWTIGPFESRLADLQKKYFSATEDRIALRKLFRK